jgi:hypothetical protein
MTGGVIVNKDQLDALEKLRLAEIEQSDRWVSYWQDYSDIHSWQFWVVLAMLILPLIILILFIDRRKIFLLGFYGFAVHIFFAITDVFGISRGLWLYPYKLLPGIPANISLDSSFVPVAYILVYQYILNKNKNYYIWILLLCLALAFFLKPLMVGIGIFRFGGKENFLLLFWGYASVALIAKWTTDVFVYLQKTGKWSLYQKGSS